MRFSLVTACVWALGAATGALAQTANFDVFTNPYQAGQEFTAGSTVELTWTPSATPTGPVSIVLLQGSSNVTLEVGPTLTSGLDSQAGHFPWVIPTNLTAYPVFGLKISLDSNPSIYQYSFPFTIKGTTGPVTTVIRISQVSTYSSTSTAFNSSTTAVANATSSANSTTSFIPTSTGRVTPSPTASTSSIPTGAASSNAVVGSVSLFGALFVTLSMLL